MFGDNYLRKAMFDTDQVDKNFIADLLLILIILFVVIGGFIALHTESILLGGSLAVTVAVVAEYVWSRTGKS
jgi:hypothetical protein